MAPFPTRSCGFMHAGAAAPLNRPDKPTVPSAATTARTKAFSAGWNAASATAASNPGSMGTVTACTRNERHRRFDRQADAKSAAVTRNRARASTGSASGVSRPGMSQGLSVTVPATPSSRLVKWSRESVSSWRGGQAIDDRVGAVLQDGLASSRHGPCRRIQCTHRAATATAAAAVATALPRLIRMLARGEVNRRRARAAARV